MPNTNQNARQSTQEAAQAVRGLTNRSTDYHRLPTALRAIVDVHNLLDIANDQMAPVRRGDGMRPEDAPSGRMARELADLVEHTLWEIRRHGVIEGALAWLASHPEGWDDEPEPELAEATEDCPYCGGSLASTNTPGVARCLACGEFLRVRRIAGMIADAEQHPWGAKAATTQCRHGHWLIECVECQNDDQGDDPLLHGYPREWFTGDRS